MTALIHDCGENENLWAIAMKWVADREGLTGTFFKPLTGAVNQKCVTKQASNLTVQAVKMISVRPLTSEQIAGLLGIHPNSVSNRMASLQRADVIRCVGKKREGKWQQMRNVWGPGPRVGEWLERMERNA